MSNDNNDDDDDDDGDDAADDDGDGSCDGDEDGYDDDDDDVDAHFSSERKHGSQTFTASVLHDDSPRLGIVCSVAPRVLCSTTGHASTVWPTGTWHRHFAIRTPLCNI